MVNGVQTGRRETANLPHSAPQDFARAMGLLNERFGAQDNGTYGCPHAFRETDGNGIEQLTISTPNWGRRHLRPSTMNHGIPTPSTIQVQWQSVGLARL